MSDWYQDLRLAVRELRRSRGFVTAIAATLSIGLAFNIVLFSMLHAVRKPLLPYVDPDRLVAIAEAFPPYGWTQQEVSLATFHEIRSGTAVFESVAAYSQRRVSAAGPRARTRVHAAVVSSDLWTVLGIQPIEGRAFSSVEDRPGAPPAVIIGHRLGTDLFGPDLPAVGRTLAVDGMDRIVVGVMPEGIHFPETESLWLPLGSVLDADVEALNRRTARGWDVAARMAPGAALPMVSQDLARLSGQLAEAFPEAHRDWQLTATPIRDVSFRATGRFFSALQVLGLLLILIMCGNLGNLLLARNEHRRRELAIYSALGASSWRLFRLHMAQVGLCAAAALGLALVGAWWAVDLIPHAIPEPLPFFIRFRIDSAVLLFGLLLAACAAAAAGAGTALRAARSDLQPLLADASGALVSPARQGRMQSVFLFVQALLAAALLASSLSVAFGLLRLNQRNVGFNPADATLVAMPLPAAVYSDAARTRLFVSTLLSRLDGVPGVGAAGVSVPIGLSTPAGAAGSIEVDRGRDSLPVDSFIAVTPDYFPAMGMPVRGRSFSDTDDVGAESVAIINREAARRLFGTEAAEGRRIRFGRSVEDRRWRTVVGVVDNTIEQPLDPEVEPRIYVPFAQEPGRNLTIVVRAERPGSLGAVVLDAIREVDPMLAAETPTTWDERLATALWPVRFFSAFAALASICGLIVASAGVYGLTRYLALARVREIALRLALGSEATSVMWLIARRTLWPVSLGLTAGLLCSVAISMMLQHTIVGSPALDPVALALSVVVLAGAAAWAIGAPTLAAARIAPAEALRSA